MLYFYATKKPETQNRNQFKDLVADYIGNELLKNATVDNWDIIFDTLLDSPTEQKKLIVLDEFQYIGRADLAFPSIFKKHLKTLIDLDILERQVPITEDPEKKTLPY